MILQRCLILEQRFFALYVLAVDPFSGLRTVVNPIPAREQLWAPFFLGLRTAVDPLFGLRTAADPLSSLRIVVGSPF